MKSIIVTLTLIAGCATLAFGSPEADIKTLEQQWLDAYVKADTNVLKTIEAEDWTLVESDGSVTTKAEDIKDVADKTFVCKSASMNDVTVKFMGDNYAYATGIVKMAGSYKGKEFNSDFRAVDIFQKKDGKWQALYSQISRIDKKKE